VCAAATKNVLEEGLDCRGQTQRVRSVLQETLFVDAWDPTLGRHRSPYAFRGLSDTSHRLETTLIRLGGNFEDLERTSCATSGSTRTGMWSSGTR
jgi:hypothetical protein